MCRGEFVRVPSGAWQVPDGIDELDGVFAFVIVSGLLCREVGLRDRYMFELLGPGNVLQLPLLADGPRLGGPVRLTAAVDTELVALGESFARAAARWPSLLTEVLRRLEAQRESLAIQGLIAHVPRAEHRVLLILWHLAERWGRVTPAGTVLHLALTHDVLGQLIGARRSTATLAVSALEKQGYLRRLDDGGWLLTAAAESKIEAIAGADGDAGVLGETFGLRQRMVEVTNDALALRAEAKQLRAQSRRVSRRSSGA
jgi:CRP/FNR family transcriptional regulator, cyclic AMP receptor protein